MNEQRVRKTSQDRLLLPTPAHEQALEMVLSRCRTLSHVALAQRKTWWERGQGRRATYSPQALELPDLKATCPDDAEVHSPVLQDVLRWGDKTSQACLQRVAQGEAPGDPHCQGTNRYHSSTSPHDGPGAVLDGGVLSLAKMGWLPIRLHRPRAGTPQTVTVAREADGWYACFSCAEVP